jgi:hypothetical protein
MPITPDTKDWTWVLERRCPECGFDTSSFARETTGEFLRRNAERWQELLAHPKAGERPSEDRWSALEYGCHVRDVFDLYNERLRMMLEEEDPGYPNWDQNISAIEDRYAQQDPDEVAKEIVAAAEKLATRFDGVAGPQWERTGRRSDGANFTVESFARYLIHDPVHHVHDAEVGYERLD